MKYTTEIEINVPLAQVIALFDSPENLSKWQPELVSFKHVSGMAGEVGAKSRLLYKMGKGEVEMIETITRKDLPNAFEGTYEAKGVYNIISNRFSEIGPEKTRWIAENEFKFNGIMALMGFLMPGAFKKQTLKYMQQFKNFAEITGDEQPKTI